MNYRESIIRSVANYLFPYDEVAADLALEVIPASLPLEEDFLKKLFLHFVVWFQKEFPVGSYHEDDEAMESYFSSETGYKQFKQINNNNMNNIPESASQKTDQQAKLPVNYLPSRYQIGDKVFLDFYRQRINNCEIIAVKFHKDKVYYDVAVIQQYTNPDKEETYTIIEGIDSAYVSPCLLEPTETPDDLDAQ